MMSSEQSSGYWERVPLLMPSGTSHLVQLPGGSDSGHQWHHPTEPSTFCVSALTSLHSIFLPACLLPAASSFREQQDRGDILDLPAGAAAAPLHLTAGMPIHNLCFRCVPAPADAAAEAADSLPLWSRPVALQDGVEMQIHVVVPVTPPENQQQEQQQDAQGAAGSDAAHLTAAGAPRRGTGWPSAVAILRLSVHRRGLGCLHVVLETMHSDPPFLLENRTALPLQYRQVSSWVCVLPVVGTRVCWLAFLLQVSVEL